MINYVGIADCHGIESFRKKDESTITDRSVMIMRAAANRQRHAIYFETFLDEAAADLVNNYLHEQEYEQALECLKRTAIEFSILPEYENSLKLIPNAELDPYG